MTGKKLRRVIAAEVERQLALAQGSATFSTITVHFENKAVSIPFLPWRPRTDVTLPGRWLDGEDPAQ